MTASPVRATFGGDDDTFSTSGSLFLASVVVSDGLSLKRTIDGTTNKFLGVFVELRQHGQEDNDKCVTTAKGSIQIAEEGMAYLERLFRDPIHDPPKREKHPWQDMLKDAVKQGTPAYFWEETVVTSWTLTTTTPEKVFRSRVAEVFFFFWSGQRLNSVSCIFGKLVRVLHHIIIRIRTKLKNCIFYYSYYSRFYLRRYSSYNVSAFHDVRVQNICFLMLMLFLFKNITKKRGLLLFFQAAM